MIDAFVSYILGEHLLPDTGELQYAYAPQKVTQQLYKAVWFMAKDVLWTVYSLRGLKETPYECTLAALYTHFRGEWLQYALKSDVEESGMFADLILSELGSYELEVDQLLTSIFCFLIYELVESAALYFRYSEIHELSLVDLHRIILLDPELMYIFHSRRIFFVERPLTLGKELTVPVDCSVRALKMLRALVDIVVSEKLIMLEAASRYRLDQ
jgi:hypothetical protein